MRKYDPEKQLDIPARVTVLKNSTGDGTLSDNKMLRPTQAATKIKVRVIERKTILTYSKPSIRICLDPLTRLRVCRIDLFLSARLNAAGKYTRPSRNATKTGVKK